MWWMWIVGPLLLLLLYALTGSRDRKREAELEKWRQQSGPKLPPTETATNYREAKEVGTDRRAGVPRVATIPPILLRAAMQAGEGPVVGHFQLVEKLAYLSAIGTGAMNGSDHHTVVTKLDEKAPKFTVRPLALVEGQREPNTGVQFKKDADFMAAFVVERSIDGAPVEPGSTDAIDKAIRKWLSSPLRAALMDLPDVWLRVDGKAMAFTLYGAAEVDRLNALIGVADVLFAEHGAGGGPSLLGEPEEPGSASTIVPEEGASGEPAEVPRAEGEPAN